MYLEKWKRLDLFRDDMKKGYDRALQKVMNGRKKINPAFLVTFFFVI